MFYLLLKLSNYNFFKWKWQGKQTIQNIKLNYRVLISHRKGHLGQGKNWSIKSFNQNQACFNRLTRAITFQNLSLTYVYSLKQSTTINRLSHAANELDPFILIILAFNLSMNCGLALSLSLTYEVRASSTSLLAFPASSIREKSVLRQSFLFSSLCSNLKRKIIN